MSESTSRKDAKRKAKERDNYTCQFCGMTEEQHQEEYGRGPSAHHIIKTSDYGRDEVWNLITVCRSCHKTLEHSQARGFSEIINHHIEKRVEQEVQRAVENELDRRTVEEQEDKPEKEMVLLQEYYSHEDYERVRTHSIDKEIVGTTATTPVYECFVNFHIDSKNSAKEITEPAEKFIQSVEEADDIAAYLENEVLFE